MKPVIFITALLCSFVNAEAKNMNHTQDTLDIIATVNAIGTSADSKDWKRCQDQFAAEVFVDYSGLTGTPGSTVKSKDLIETWAKVLGPVKMTQHTITNHEVLIKGDTATVRSYVTAMHSHPVKSGEDYWLLMGKYEHILHREKTGWKVASMKLTPTYQRGNSKLLEEVGKQADVTRAKTFHAGINPVSFLSSGEKIVGNLYLPKGYQDGKKLPTVIVTGSWTTVKEQMAGTYAKQLSDRGMAALTFDFRNFGESGGDQRQFESSDSKIADIKSAVNFLSTLPLVDQSRLAGLGICASSGYMAYAVAEDKRIRAFAAVAPWLHNTDLVKSIYGGEAGVRAKIAAAKAAKAHYEKNGTMDYVPAISTTDQNAAMFGEFDYYLNPKRGAIPEWNNRFAVMSWESWLTFDAIKAADLITAPTLLVHSEHAAIPDGAKAFYQKLKGQKSIVWTDGTQFDFYDQTPQVTHASDEVAHYFEKVMNF